MFLGLDGRGVQGNALWLHRHFRETEVENLRLTSIRHEDVRGLDVPMDYSLRVCGIEGIGELDAQIEHRCDLQRLASDPMPKRLPVEQFHGDEGSPIGIINFVDRADVRVVQRGRSLGFPLKTTEGLGVVSEFVGKELQGDVATELYILGLIDNAHAAATQLLDDAVVRDCLVYHWRECYVCKTG